MAVEPNSLRYHAALGIPGLAAGVDWAEVRQRLLPGGHVAFDPGARPWRVASAAEAVGFEIRDSIVWMTDAGARHVILARRALEGTVAANVRGVGAGVLNIDGCRVGQAKDVPAVHATRTLDYPQSYVGDGPGWGRSRGGAAGDRVDWEPAGGRWPTNLILSHSTSCVPLGLGPDAGWDCHPACPVGRLDATVGMLKSGAPGIKRLSSENRGACYGAESRPSGTVMPGYGDAGGPSRFFPRLPAGAWWAHSWFRRLLLPEGGRLLLLGPAPRRARMPSVRPRSEPPALFPSAPAPLSRTPPPFEGDEGGILQPGLPIRA